MKKYIISLTIFIVLCLTWLSHQNFYLKNLTVQSENQPNETSIQDSIVPLCSDKIEIDPNFLEIQKVSIKIEINDSRAWYQNLIKAKLNALQNSNLITPKFKKKFGGKVILINHKNQKCSYDAKININGDLGDHIRINANGIASSLAVELKDGNLFGIVKFKLLLPETRNNTVEARDNEVVLASLFSELGILSPRTAKTHIYVNGDRIPYIFQEDIEKELLEYNKKREAPILEFNEVQYWKDFLKNDANVNYNSLTAKIKNSNWLTGSRNRQAIAKRGIDILNNALILDLPQPAMYNLEEAITELSNNNKNLFIYRSIIAATNSYHALDTRNRNFYFNPIDNTLEPIYYDGNPKIMGLLSPTNSFDLLPNIPNSNFAEQALKNIDASIFHKKLKKLGVKISLKEVEALISNLIQAIQVMQKSPITYNQTLYPEEGRFSNFTDTDFKVAFNTSQEDTFQICNTQILECKLIKLNSDEIDDLLSGKLKIHKNNLYYSGQSILNYKDNKVNVNHLNFNQQKIDGKTNLLTFGDVSLELNSKDKLIKVLLKSLTSRVLFSDGELQDWSIIVNSDFSAIIDTPDRFDQHLLTGCLTFSNIKFLNVNIETSNSHCEDSINFINSSGNLENISVSNSKEDGLDADFSDLYIANLNVLNTDNDCVDLSQGSYYLKKLTLKDCKDKAVSAGEKSEIKIEKLKVLNSKNGIAIKDWSSLYLNDGNIESKNYCVALYRKKQEFGRGVLRYSNISCQNDNFLIQENSSMEKIK